MVNGLLSVLVGEICEFCDVFETLRKLYVETGNGKRMVELEYKFLWFVMEIGLLIRYSLFVTLLSNCLRVVVVVWLVG